MKKNYRREDIINLVEEEDVEFIRLQFTDILGNLKNVAVTAAQLKKALDNECMFDASSIAGFTDVEDSDMYLYPDLDTLEIFPWRPQQGKVARLICDVYRSDRKPFAGDPRYVLKRALEEAEDMGYTFRVGTECEEIWCLRWRTWVLWWRRPTTMWRLPSMRSAFFMTTRLPRRIIS